MYFIKTIIDSLIDQLNESIKKQGEIFSKYNFEERTLNKPKNLISLLEERNIKANKIVQFSNFTPLHHSQLAKLSPSVIFQLNKIELKTKNTVGIETKFRQNQINYIKNWCFETQNTNALKNEIIDDLHFGKLFKKIDEIPKIDESIFEMIETNLNAYMIISELYLRDTILKILESNSVSIKNNNSSQLYSDIIIYMDWFKIIHNDITEYIIQKDNERINKLHKIDLSLNNLDKYNIKNNITSLNPVIQKLFNEISKNNSKRN